MAAYMSPKKMKIFFPSHCLRHNSGFILGWKKEQENIFVAVTVICSSVISNNFWERFSRLLTENKLEFNSVSLSVFGIWINENDERSVGDFFASAKAFVMSLTKEMIIVRPARNAHVPQVYVFSDDKFTADGCVIVLYRQPSGNSFLTAGPASGNNSDFWRQLQCHKQVPSTELSEVFVLLNRSHHDEVGILAMVEAKDNLPSPNNAGVFISLVLEALRRACGLFSQRRMINLSICSKIVKFLSNLSAVILQCCVRFSQVKVLCTCVAQLTSPKNKRDSNLSESRSSSGTTNVSKERNGVFPSVWFGSLVTAISIDIILGIVIVIWLFSNGYDMCATDFVMEKTDAVVEFLRALLDWIKGAPAGLKLNKQLAEYLSTFFLYHIYLWQIYLGCVEPYLQIITSVVIISGCFGVTFLLSLLSEVLSVITLHIYCFYVYAARLYNFQLKKLITLFRLFTGRRWNVEKNKVDSVPFKADRLFLGTLCFTVLLFLLPTTAMYYVVFTILRLIVLLAKGAISKAVDTLNNLPVFPLIVACVRPDLVPGGVKFELLDSPDFPGDELSVPQCVIRGVTGPIPSVCLALHSQPIPLTELLCHKFVDKIPHHPACNHGWLVLLNKLGKGELIYPWVKPRNAKEE